MNQIPFPIFSKHSLFILMGVFSLLNGCTRESASDPSQLTVKEMPPSTVLLTYRGGKISAGDLREVVAPQLEKIRDETVEVYRKEAERLALSQVLEAKARLAGFKSGDEYLENLRTQTEVSDADIAEFMKKNHLPLGSKEEARKFLQDQAYRTKIELLNQSLLKEADLVWKIAEVTHDIREDSSIPSKGAKHGKVVVDEFCDFTNTQCKPTLIPLEQLVGKYSQDVTFHYHPVVSTNSDQARPAVIAAFCAAKQDHFWEMQKKLFDHQTTLNPPNFLLYAKEIGLDPKNFEACVANSKTNADVADAQNRANTRGVTETPAFFVNGERMNSVDQVSERVQTLLQK